MDYRTYKMKTFAEKPEVRAEYEQLGPQYEAICAAIESRKAAGLTQKQLAEKWAQHRPIFPALKTEIPIPRWSFCKKWLPVWAKRFTFHLSDHKNLFSHFTIRSLFQRVHCPLSAGGAFLFAKIA